MAGTEQAADALRLLDVELDRHPPERYPVQHATALFHLGTVLLDLDRPVEAEVALRRAAELFASLAGERAKAQNMLGVALRVQRRSHEAVATFTEAVAGFGEADLAVEEAAATFNVGLVRAEVGDHAAALAAFRRAHELFRRHRLPVQATAAARELGATLVALGETEEAVPVLEQAMAEADQQSDRLTFGAAANALGLAHLAGDRPDEAVASLQAAAGAHPRAVRPDAHAMAKANLALAYDAAGEPARARLSARQARDTPRAPANVVAQAEAVLEHLGPASDDLLVVLDGEPADRWPAIVREEVARWLDASADDRAASAAALVEGQLARPQHAVDIAEAWLSVLLELPPDTMRVLVERMLRAVLAHDEDERAAFETSVARATARFHVPQLLRLREVFAEIAAQVGVGGSWR